MFKRILPALLVLGSTSAIAQPTLTLSNVGPVINDAFVSMVCDTTGILPGSSGTNITWHFETLQPSTTILPNKDTGIVIAAATGTGYSSLAAGAAFLGSSADFTASTYATATPSNTATTYYQASTTKIAQTGVYIDAGNNAVYTNALDQLHFPFSYSNTFTDLYAGGLTYTPSGMSPVTATESGSVTVTADAYGTLVLPGTPSNTTYTNVLRVHSVQTFRDSANLFGTPVISDYTLHSYTWYSPGYHAPLLTISTATGTFLSTKTVSYFYKQTANHDAVPYVTGLDASVTVYPNPVNDYITVSYNNATNLKVRVSIVDLTGREIAVISDQFSQGITNVGYNTTGLAKGTYLVKLQSENETITRKVTVQ